MEYKIDRDIYKILEAGTMAPSGENVQPWKFSIKNKTIKISNLPERDQSPYSWGQRASYIANGAALENICIAAKEYGYEPDVAFFPEKQNQNLVAEVKLNKGVEEKNILYNFIAKRTTNRKAYATKPLQINEVKELFESVDQLPVKLYFTQDPSHKKILGKAGSANEGVMLNNKYLHQFFFSHINWTRDEDNRKKIGFFIDTLELPLPIKMAFHLLKYWPIMVILNKIGLNSIAEIQNAQINSSSSGFGAITISSNSPSDFVQVGKAVQKLWLTATKLGLSLQPLTGILFFMYKILAGDTAQFKPSQVKKIKKAYRSIQSTFNIDERETVAFMFRIGYSDKPTARSSRFSVEDVTEIY